MALQLYLNGEAADLPIAARVRLNQATNAVDQLDVRIGERSYSFTLPPTRTNDRLLAHARQQLQANKFKRPTEISARLVADGVDVLPVGAVCRLNVASAQGYEVVLYAPGVGLGEILASKQLRDLTTLPERAYADLNDLAALLAGNRATETLAAPLVAYGNFFGTDDTQPLNTIDEGMRLDDYVLSVYALNVLKACFTEAGYTLQGKLLTAPEWQDVVIPYTRADDFPWPYQAMLAIGSGLGYVYNRSGSPQDTYQEDQLGLLSAPRTRYAGYMGEFLYWGDGGTGMPDVPVYVATNTRSFLRFQAPTAGQYLLLGGYTYTYMGAGLQPRVRTAVHGGNEVASVQFITPATGPTGTATFDHTVTVSGPCTIEVLVTDANPGSGPTCQSVGVSIVKLDGPATIQPAHLLPDMSQKDFVKAILTLTNSTFTLDEERKTVTLLTRDALTPQQITTALDLDDFLDPAAFSYRPAAQFKAVNFTFAADVNDAVAVAGSADALVPLPSAGRADTKEIAVPFATTGTREYLQLPLLQPPSVPPPPVPHVLACIASTEALTQKRSETQWSYDYAPRLLRQGLPSAAFPDPDRRVIRVYHSHSNQTEINYRPARNAFTWSELVDSHYAASLELLDSSELVTSPILLTPTLYRQLTPGRVVRVNGVVYIVNKTEGYEPGGSQAATVELLKYVPPAGR